MMFNALIVLLISTAVRGGYGGQGFSSSSFNGQLNSQGINPSNQMLLNQQVSPLSPISVQSSQFRSQIPISSSLPLSQPVLGSGQLLGSPQLTLPSPQLSQPLSQFSGSSQISSMALQTSQISQPLSQSVESLRTPQVSQPNLQSIQSPNLALQTPQLLSTQLSQSIPQSLLTITRSGAQALPIPQSIPRELITAFGPEPLVLPQSIPSSLLSGSRLSSVQNVLPQSIPQSLLSVPQTTPLLSPAQRAVQLNSQSQQQISQQLPALSQSTPLATNSQQLRDTSAFSTPVKSLNFVPTLPQPMAPQPLAQIRAPVLQTSGFVSQLNTPILRSQQISYPN